MKGKLEKESEIKINLMKSSVGDLTQGDIKDASTMDA